MHTPMHTLTLLPRAPRSASAARGSGRQPAAPPSTCRAATPRPHACAASTTSRNRHPNHLHISWPYQGHQPAPPDHLHHACMLTPMSLAHRRTYTAVSLLCGGLEELLGCDHFLSQDLLPRPMVSQDTLQFTNTSGMELYGMGGGGGGGGRDLLANIHSLPFIESDTYTVCHSHTSGGHLQLLRQLRTDVSQRASLFLDGLQ